MSGKGIRPARAIGACAALLSMSACGDVAPEPDPPLNTLGSSGRVGQMSLHNVYVLGAADGRYVAGERARVRLTLVNDGNHDDALVKVTSAAASAARMHWDKGCDGTAESVQRITVAASGLVPQAPLPASQAQATTGTERSALHQPYYVTLVAGEEIRRGTTVPITFTFERAGTVTIEAMVQSRHRLDEQARFACIAGDATGSSVTAPPAPRS